MQVEVKLEHLEKAIGNLDNYKSYGCACLVASAIQEHFGESVTVYSECFTYRDRTFNLDEMAQHLIKLFDHHQYAVLQQMLPRTISFEEQK